MGRWTGLTVLLLAVALGACAGDGAGDAGDTGDGALTADTMAVAGGDVALACEPTATGEELAGRSSPYDSTTLALDGGRAKICYSRPQLRGRTMIGGEAVPYDTLWRTGANEPTIIHLDTPAEIAGLRVEPGSYSLYTVPREQGAWTLIVNRSTSQWGHESQYTPEVRAQEVGRAEVQSERIAEPVEQFTIRTMDGGETGVVLEWQNSRVRVPIRPVT